VASCTNIRLGSNWFCQGQTLTNIGEEDKKFLDIDFRTVHLKIKDFQCLICNKKFGLKYSLNVHLKLVHESSKEFECHLCNNRYHIHNNPFSL